MSMRSTNLPCCLSCSCHAAFECAHMTEVELHLVRQLETAFPWQTQHGELNGLLSRRLVCKASARQSVRTLQAE